MDPKISIPQGAQNGVQPFAANSTEMGHASTTHVDTATSATDAQVLTRDINAVKDPQAIATTPQRVVTNPANQSISKIILSLPTPISVDNLEVALTGHPETHFTSQICNNLRYGARIGFQGRRIPRFSKNLPTALANPSIVSANLAKEISLGRVAGPFDSPPFSNLQVSPIGIVPKKNSKKFRLIFHLSFPKSGMTSINSAICKDDFSLQYVTIDDAIEGIKRFGPGCFLAKTDIESAFRLIPVHPDDYELLGMFWDGKYYFDKVLPFGLRSAPFIFNQLSDAVEWILLNNCKISFACHILDDFLIMEPKAPSMPHDSTCLQSLSKMLLTFHDLKIPSAPGKTQGPLQVLEFMGIILDTVKM